MAAVMRAMSQSMGVSSTPRMSSGHSHSHSIGSSDGGYTSGSAMGEELSRTSSRLAPPNPATVFGSPSGGILINAQRPSHPGRMYSNDSFSSAGTDLKRNGNSSRSLASLVENESLPSLSPSHSRTTSLATDGQDERGRSISRDSTHTPNGATSPSSVSRKIRFAPLPEIRPRSYSTGRNVWVDADGVDITEEDPSARRLTTRDVGDEDALDTDSEDDSEEGSTSKGIFGSWRSESGFGGMGDSKKENDDGYASKLLRPLSFGLGKKKKSRSPSADRDSLARVSSADSDASSRRSADSPRTIQSTGVPMRKARTWELGETQPRESRRANYPPVAQRSKTRMRQSMSTGVPEPKFVEWGGAGGVGSVVGAKGVGGSKDEDEDDGSGMAWIKKRRAQREAEAAQKKKEEEEAAAKAMENDATATEEDSPPAATATDIIPPAVTLTEPYSPNPSNAPGSPSGTSTPVPRTSLLTNSRPQLHLVTPSSPSVPTLSNDGEDSSRSSDSPITPFDESTESQASTKTSESSRNRLSVASDGVPGLSEGEDSDEEEEEDDEQEDRDNSDDLDEEELRLEELACEAARATAIGAGAERYHDKDHKTRMLKVDGKQTPKVVN